jgi:hypothetical protein
MNADLIPSLRNCLGVEKFNLQTSAQLEPALKNHFSSGDKRRVWQI